MWLLVAVLLAAAPAAAGPGPAVPVAATPPVTCEGAQRCDDRCIAWTESCPSALADTVKASMQADQQRILLATLCTGSPRPATRDKTPEAIAAIAIAQGSVAAMAHRDVSIADGRRLPSEQPVAPPPPVSPPPPCGPPTVAAPSR